MFTEFGDLLPYRHPFVQVHTKFANQFGGANNITIMVEVKNGTIFNKETLTKIFKMTQIIDILPGINHDQIDSIGHRSTRYMKMEGGIDRHAAGDAARADDGQRRRRVRNIVHYSESLHGILVSLDDKAALIRANFFEGRVNYRQLFYDVDDKIITPFQDDNTTIWVAGEPRLYGWIYHYTSEVWYIFAGCTIFLWILLYAYFHDWRGALRPTLTGVMSAIWGLGVVHLIGFPMDPLSLVIPFFVTARSVSHSVQMHDRYYEEYHRHNWNKTQAIVAAFAELFEPTLSGIVTDALGMLVIVLIPVVILQRIAISASIWVAAIVISEFVLNPIIYYYLKAPEKENVLSREEGPFQTLHHLVEPPRRRPKGALGSGRGLGRGVLHRVHPAAAHHDRRRDGVHAAPAARLALQPGAHAHPEVLRRRRAADHRRRGQGEGRRSRIPRPWTRWSRSSATSTAIRRSATASRSPTSSSPSTWCSTMRSRAGA